MKTLTTYETEYCLFEIIKIKNGYILKITGIGDDNSDYCDCIYYSTKEETFKEFKFFVSIAGGVIDYDIKSILW